MSKANKNIEKVILGVGLVAGGALAALGVLKNKSVAEDFGGRLAEPSSNIETSVSGLKEISRTVNSLLGERKFPAALVEAPNLEEGNRPVDLFIGVPLFASRENTNEPIDLVTSDDVHPEIPNSWWLKYGVNPSYGDSPQRDDDEDGFTNLEEYQAKTDPSDARSHPPLIAKLSYIKDESKWWLVEYGSFFDNKWYPKIQIEGGQAYKTNFNEPVEANGLLFPSADKESGIQNRFKFLRVEDRTTHNQRLNIDETMKYAVFEDQQENKKGKIYSVPSRLPRAERVNAREFDRTAILELQALSEIGKEFKVQENTKFGLPIDSKEKNFLLKEVSPEKIIIEWEDGEQKKMVEIRKGGLPKIDLNAK